MFAITSRAPLSIGDANIARDWILKTWELDNSEPGTKPKKITII